MNTLVATGGGVLLGRINLEPGALIEDRGLSADFFGKLGNLSGQWFKNMVTGFDASFGSAPKGTELALEFGVTLKLEGNIVEIIKAGAEADMKLQLKRTLTS